MIYTFTAAAAYAEAAAAYATAAAAYADMVKIRLSTALALFSWGLAELGKNTFGLIPSPPVWPLEHIFRLF